LVNPEEEEEEDFEADGNRFVRKFMAMYASSIETLVEEVKELENST
jgi:hypothetical protein